MRRLKEILMLDGAPSHFIKANVADTFTSEQVISLDIQMNSFCNFFDITKRKPDILDDKLK